MPYIGNPIYQSAFVTDQFSGNGSTTAFTMSVAPAGVTNVLVAVSGVLQDPSTYGVSGNTLTFSAAPPSGTGNISCRYLGIPVTGVVTTAYRTVTEFTATASQTTFTPPSYTVGYINVYRNGVLLGSADYTATNGTTVVLTTGATAGDLVTVESFYVSSVLNAIPNAAGAVSSTNLASGIVTPAKLSTGGPSWDSSGNVTTTGTLTTSSRGISAASVPTGSVLQVVYANYATQVTNNTATYADTGLTASITPKYSSSKILVLACVNGLEKSNSATANGVGLKLLRDASVISNYIRYASWTNATTSMITPSGFFSYLDSPATTSSITYKVQFANENNVAAVFVQSTSNASSMTIMEIAG